MKKFYNKKFKFLSINDKLKKDDYIRILFENGEEGGFNTTYKPEGYNPLEWHKIKEDLPGWIGKTFEDYAKFVLENPSNVKDLNELFEGYEIIRILKNKNVIS